VALRLIPQIIVVEIRFTTQLGMRTKPFADYYYFEGLMLGFTKKKIAEYHCAMLT
jgi:hypothetical protein